jgi:hypothetical protein
MDPREWLLAHTFDDTATVIINSGPWQMQVGPGVAVPVTTAVRRWGTCWVYDRWVVLQRWRPSRYAGVEGDSIFVRRRDPSARLGPMCASPTPETSGALPYYPGAGLRWVLGDLAWMEFVEGPPGGLDIYHLAERRFVISIRDWVMESWRGDTAIVGWRGLTTPDSVADRLCRDRVERGMVPSVDSLVMVSLTDLSVRPLGSQRCSARS